MTTTSSTTTNVTIRAGQGVREYLGCFDDRERALVRGAHSADCQEHQRHANGADGRKHDSEPADDTADEWVVGQEVIGPGIQRTPDARMGEATEGENPKGRDRGHQHRRQENRAQSCGGGRRQAIEGASTKQRYGEEDCEGECDETGHWLPFRSAARLAASSGSRPFANPASTDARSLVASRSEWILRAVTCASVADAR